MKTIAPDDWKVGMLVTVSQPMVYESAAGGGIFDLGPATLVKREDRSYMGDVLRVETVMLPYVVLRMVVSRHGHSGEDRITSLDSRQWTFSRVAISYAKVLLRAARQFDRKYGIDR